MARSAVLVSSFLACVLSCALTWVMRTLATRVNLIDNPNERSSHIVPTPRAGGVAIALAFYAGAFFVGLGQLDQPLLLVMLVCGGVVATTGLLDDWLQLAPLVRVLVHLIAATVALWLLRGLPVVQIGSLTFSSGAVGYIIGTLAVVWVLNLYNFMDGIDGLAGSEAVFVATAGALLLETFEPNTSAATAAWILAAASLGFLVWNWPRATIFMGDSGSGFLGFALAVLCVSAGHDNAAALWAWIVLGGVFLVDATVTLVRRLARGEHPAKPHRSHAYQHLARQWSSHRKVTIAVTIVNCVWLLPFAWACFRYPEKAAVLAALALMPLVVLSLACGAGASES